MSKYANQIKFDGNIIRWISSNAIPFADVLADLVKAGVITEAQASASVQQRSVEEALAIARYISYREKHGYSAEERAEIAAEFGDEDAIDVFTGKAIH